MTGTSTLGALLLATTLVGSPGSAAALEPEDILIFQKGPLTVRPQLGLTEQFNDNIFYQHEDAIQDFISIVSPGLKLQLGRPEHNYFSAGYTLDQMFYADNPDLNTGQHTVELSSRLDGEHMDLTGSDRLQLLSNPLGGVVERVVQPGGVDTVTGVNVDRTTLDDTYTLSYDIGEKTGVYVRGMHSSVDYEEGIALYDIRTITGTVGFGYRAFPKTVFFGEMYYGQTATDPNARGMRENPRLSMVGGYAGVRGNFTPKLSGVAKLGYEVRSFSDGTSAPSEPVGRSLPDATIYGKAIPGPDLFAGQQRLGSIQPSNLHRGSHRAAILSDSWNEAQMANHAGGILLSL